VILAATWFAAGFCMVDALPVRMVSGNVILSS
jgi:hypothetical protein